MVQWFALEWSRSPFPTKQIPQGHFFSSCGISTLVVLCKGIKKWDVSSELQCLLLPEQDVCVSVHLCVGVYSPQASWGNVIVFNSLFAYPWAKHIHGCYWLSCLGTINNVNHIWLPFLVFSNRCTLILNPRPYSLCIRINHMSPNWYFLHKFTAM